MTDEELLSQPLPTRPRRRALTRAGAVSGAVAVGALGFLGGVQAQKAQGGTAAGPPRLGAGFPGGALPEQGGDAMTGEVSSVDGSTFYVEDASGNTVRVRAGAKAKVTRTAVVDADEVHPGDTVVVTGRTASSGTVVATSVVATASNAGR
jgi:hypothetical protein